MSANEPSAAVAVDTFFPVSVFEAVTVTPGSGVTPALMVPRTMNCETAITGACCGLAGAAAVTAAAVVCAEPATAYNSSAQPAAASRNSEMTDFFIETTWVEFAGQIQSAAAGPDVRVVDRRRL